VTPHLLKALRTALICGIVLSMPGWAFAQTVAPPSAVAAAPPGFRTARWIA
jgi:hypothetical protein